MCDCIRLGNQRLYLVSLMHRIIYGSHRRQDQWTEVYTSCRFLQNEKMYAFQRLPTYWSKAVRFASNQFLSDKNSIKKFYFIEVLFMVINFVWIIPSCPVPEISDNTQFSLRVYATGKEKLSAWYHLESLFFQSSVPCCRRPVGDNWIHMVGYFNSKDLKSRTDVHR